MRPKRVLQLAMPFWLLCLCVCPGRAAAAVLHHGSYAGTTLNFVSVWEESFTDGLPLYGAPMVLGDVLGFFPRNFSASAAGGSSDTTAGRLVIETVSMPGLAINGISVAQIGDWLLSGVGTSATAVSASATLKVTSLTHGGATFTTPVVFNVGQPVALGAAPPSGSWTAEGAIDLLNDLGWFGASSVVIELDNMLVATSEPGTTAFGQNKVVVGAVVAIATGPIPAPVIPEPGSILIWSLGGLLGVWLMRRRQRG